MIIGSHVIVYSKNPDADRELVRDVLELSHVDAGGGWLIFGLPPSEMAFHPNDGSQTHEFYLMCEDVEAFIRAMQSRALACTPVREERWGLLTELTLPGGGKLGVYQPRHARPKAAGVKSARRARAKKPKKPPTKIRKQTRASSRSKRARR
ncbi:MAG: extradiol dioxygenase [Steroidobacteraceae bacterium]